ncbi:helix-turn-helix domain-containing protein [Paraburkholderia bannensis]|uniref:helix-turn-helix domain-containing protein n=1 Tax=Paraburkholderia bannensis TaxID=765414 RepID=UPI000488DE78|nr:helix-turn-helix transcriptional regulator [Paraburkholderia bannensis]
MPITSPKAAFAARLLCAMLRKSASLKGATGLARLVNQQAGAKPVSPQTVHKWLSGRTIPEQARLEQLAHLLEVDLHWLHHGPSPTTGAAPPPATPRDLSALTAPMIELLWNIAALAPHDQDLVERLVSRLSGLAEPQ